MYTVPAQAEAPYRIIFSKLHVPTFTQVID